jgi:hypothetical protein
MLDPHILKTDGTGRLRHLPFSKMVDIGRSDVVQEYSDSVNQLLDYFENFFAPKDVVKYCQWRIDRIRKYLTGNVNVGINKPLTDEKIESETNRIKGFEIAIERNKSSY